MEFGTNDLRYNRPAIAALFYCEHNLLVVLGQNRIPAHCTDNFLRLKYVYRVPVYVAGEKVAHPDAIVV